MPARAWPGATKTSTVSIRLSEQLRFSSEPAGASLVIQFWIYCVRCCLDILFSRFLPYWFVLVGGGGCHWDRYSQIVACKEVPTTWSDQQRWLAGCVMVPDKTPADSTRKFPPLSTPLPWPGLSTVSHHSNSNTAFTLSDSQPTMTSICHLIISDRNWTGIKWYLAAGSLCYKNPPGPTREGERRLLSLSDQATGFVTVSKLLVPLTVARAKSRPHSSVENTEQSYIT